MAHPANRPIDFAPAWLKLPEQAQVQKRHTLESNHQSSRSSNTSSSHHSLSNGFQSHNHYQPRDYNYHNHSSSSSADRYSSHYQHPHHHHHNSHQPHPTSAGAPPTRHGRQSLSSYNSRSSGPHQQQGLLQRSQSTGSYTENGNRTLVGSVPVSDPLEEDFPLLSSGPSNPVSKQKSLANTVQWRVKPAVGDQQRSKDDNSENSCQNDDKNLLTNKQPGKVYRAQVRPVRRSNMIPIGNGRGAATRPDQNGVDHDHTSLSSSVEKEKRLLQEMGWKEEDDSEDDCVIPEQDPEQLQEIMMQAKAARERLLRKSKQTLKPMNAVTATLPNEDELASSSDNSDAE